MDRTPLTLEERAVNDEIGVTADGGGEERATGFGEAIMTERLHCIAGAHERSEKADFERLTDGKGAELLQELLDFGAAAQIAARHIVAEELLAIIPEPFFVRLFVDAINRRLALAHQSGGHRLVRRQHEPF